MLVICVKTGLTYARKVHREGEVFILTGVLEREYKDLSDEAWNRKQKRTYSGYVTFRRPTSDEIIAAIRDKKLDPGNATVRGHLSKKQLRIALDYAESKEAKKLKAIQMLRESVDMEIEEAPEEKAEVVKAPEKEAEAPPEEPVEAVELPEESEESVKEPAEKAPEEAPEAPEEEPKAEEPVKEPEVLEEKVEAPEEEPKPEESVKEASGKKKDKKKT